MLRILKAEILKLIRTKSFIVLASILIVLMIGLPILQGATSVLDSSYKNRIDEDDYMLVSNSWLQTFEGYISKYEDDLDKIAMSPKEIEETRITVTELKSNLKLLQYFYDNGIKLYKIQERYIDMYSKLDATELSSSNIGYTLAVKNYSFPNGNIYLYAENNAARLSIVIYSDVDELSLFMGTDTIAYIFFFVAILLTLFTFTTELRNGSMKLLLLRPIKRTTLLIEKMLSVAIIITALLIVSCIFYTLSSVVTAWMFGVSYKVVPILVTGNKTFTMSIYAINILKFIDVLITSIAFLSLAMFASIRSKNPVVVMIIPFAILIGVAIISAFLPNIAYLNFLTNLQFFTNYLFNERAYAFSNAFLPTVLPLMILALFVALSLLGFKSFDFDKANNKSKE